MLRSAGVASTAFFLRDDEEDDDFDDFDDLADLVDDFDDLVVEVVFFGASISTSAKRALPRVVVAFAFAFVFVFLVEDEEEEDEPAAVAATSLFTNCATGGSLFLMRLFNASIFAVFALTVACFALAVARSL